MTSVSDTIQHAKNSSTRWCVYTFTADVPNIGAQTGTSTETSRASLDCAHSKGDTANGLWSPSRHTLRLDPPTTKRQTQVLVGLVALLAVESTIGMLLWKTARNDFFPPNPNQDDNPAP